MSYLPILPLLRENFIQRVYVYKRWRDMHDDGRDWTARPRYLEAFWSLVNWDFVAHNHDD